VVHGRVGAGIKGVQPPLCVTRVRGSSAAAHAEDQQIAGVFNTKTKDQEEEASRPGADPGREEEEELEFTVRLREMKTG
jgi:hypothetical protein